MSSLVVSFNPPIDPAAEPVTHEWIETIGWHALVERGSPTPEYNIRFHVDDQWFEYQPQRLGGVLHDLVLMRSGICSDPPGMTMIQGSHNVLARLSGDVVQFTEVVDWQPSPDQMPEAKFYDIGEPIAREAVDLAFRTAIAAAWRQFETSFN